MIETSTTIVRPEHPILDSYEAYGCQLNSLSPEQLFAEYQRVGFLYPAKLEQLQPCWGEIVQNWRKALRGGELIFWVATYGDPGHDTWASLGSWRSTHFGWVTQHLVSEGNPVASRAVMLGGQAVRIRDGFDDAHQNWFRPANRYANKIFGSIVHTLGSDVASVTSLQYLAVPFGVSAQGNQVQVTPWHAGHSEALLELTESVRGKVYTNAEELVHPDLLLEEVDELYRMVGLRRYRRVWLAYLPGKEDCVGAIIAYRGPLGLNFSFLENRCDLLVRPELTDVEAREVCLSLLQVAVPTYVDFTPQQLFVATDSRSATLLRDSGATLIREYAQSIWLREGFTGWYRHVEKFYERVMKAEARADNSRHHVKRFSSASGATSTIQPYLMEDPRESQRLADKVDAPEWVDRYLAESINGVTSVLDVGCGPGVLASELAKRCPNADVVGVDGSESRLDEARAKHQGLANLRFIQTDAVCLPFPDNSFDLVTCRFLLQYLPNRQEVIAEMSRVCRPGGQIFLQDLDGQLVWHYPIDPDLQTDIDKVISALGKTGFDPLVGRKLFHLAKNSGLNPTKVIVDPYHLYAGTIDDDNYKLWELKLDIALPAITSSLDSEQAAARLKQVFLDHLMSPDTLTYSILFTVLCSKP